MRKTLFTSLEIAVCTEICRKDLNITRELCNILSGVVFLDRENTGRGFVTSFRAEHALSSPFPASPIIGPLAHMDNMGCDMKMGFYLWLQGGCPVSFEGFQYGDVEGRTMNLKDLNLFELKANRFEWI